MSSTPSNTQSTGSSQWPTSSSRSQSRSPERCSLARPVSARCPTAGHSVELALVIAVVVVALSFDYTNGFHDAANAIATSVSTRALTPRVALMLAAIGNFIGTHFGAKVAATVGKGILEPPQGGTGLVICAAALVGAIGWNLLTWWFG